MDCNERIYTARCNGSSRQCEECSEDDNLQEFPAAEVVTDSAELYAENSGLYVIVPAHYLERLQRVEEAYDHMAERFATVVEEAVFAEDVAYDAMTEGLAECERLRAVIRNMVTDHEHLSERHGARADFLRSVA